VFEVFYSERRIEDSVWEKVHESPPVMLKPMIILAVFSTIIGFIGIPVKKINLIGNALATVIQVKEVEHVSLTIEIMLIVITLLGSLLSIYVASVLYLRRRELLEELVNKYKGLHYLLINKYFVDEIYQKIIVKPLLYVSEKFLYNVVDVKMIDGSVNGIADGTRLAGKYLRRIQTGDAKAYAFAILLGLVIMLIYCLWKISF